MTSLAEFQRQIVADILRQPRPRVELPLSRDSSGSGIEIHRATVFGALSRALEMRYPTIARLLGEDLFQRLTMEYVRAQPPSDAVLNRYGETFPKYLESHPETAQFSYLPDIARFDQAIDHATSEVESSFGRNIALGANVHMRLLTSLRCLALSYPADQVRDATTANPPQHLGTIDLAPKPFHFAIWRNSAGVGVKRISAATALLLQALDDGQAATDALDSLIEKMGFESAWSAVENELFPASFVRLSPHPISTGQP